MLVGRNVVMDIRTITPARARAQHMHDAADHAPIIDTVGGSASARQQRLDPLPLRFA